MSQLWMYGREAGEALSTWECPVCHREVDEGGGNRGVWCRSCFANWYDGDTDPISVGNKTRKKHGLPPLETHE